MKLFLTAVAAALLIVALAAATALERRQCAGNNCNRQITGSCAGLPATSIRQSDCSSFMLTMVTPAAMTVTVTVTVTVTAYGNEGEPAERARKRGMGLLPLEARQVEMHAPSVLPAYANNCRNAPEYASACSCWGITPVGSTAPLPTETATWTVPMEPCEEDL